MVRNLRSNNICLLLTLIFLISLIFAFLPIHISISRFLYDDSFYYLVVAKNIADGQGATFDGINPTNGFQPLWMVLLKLISPFFQKGSFTFLHIVLSLSSVFHTLTAYFIFSILYEFTEKRNLSLLCCAFWGLNPFIICISLTGLETPLYTAILSASLLFYIKNYKSQLRYPYYCLGILLGLTALARFDSLILFLIIIIHQIYISFRNNNSNINSYTRKGTDTLRIILGFFIATIYWFVWSYFYSGTLLPNSGLALSIWRDQPLKLSFDSENLKLFFHKLWIFLRYYSHYNLRLIGGWWLIGGIIFLLCLYFIVKRFRGKFKHKSVFILFLIYMISHFTYYLLYSRPEPRYLIPFWLIFIIVSFISTNDTNLRNCSGAIYRTKYTRRINPTATHILFKNKLIVALMIIILTFSFLFGFISDWVNGGVVLKSMCLQETMYNEVVKWIKNNTNKLDRIGAFNAGIYGYFSNRTIINLDGVMNDNAIKSLRDKKLLEFIRNQKIKYIIDWQQPIEEFLGKDFSNRTKQRVEFVQKWGYRKNSKLLILEITTETFIPLL